MSSSNLDNTGARLSSTIRSFSALVHHRRRLGPSDHGGRRAAAIYSNIYAKLHRLGLPACLIGSPSKRGVPTLLIKSMPASKVNKRSFIFKSSSRKEPIQPKLIERCREYDELEKSK